MPGPYYFRYDVLVQAGRSGQNVFTAQEKGSDWWERRRRSRRRRKRRRGNIENIGKQKHKERCKKLADLHVAFHLLISTCHPYLLIYLDLFGVL